MSYSCCKDSRAIATRDKIRIAFLDLLIEEPYQTVFVKDVYTKAGVSKPTFYRHYTSLEDLYLDIENAFFAKYEEMLNNTDLPDTDPRSKRMLEALWIALQSNDFLLLCMMAFSQNNRLQDSFIEKIKPSYLKRVKNRFELSEAELDVQLSFLVGGALSVYRMYVKNGRKEPQDEIINAVMKFSSAVFDGLPTRHPEKPRSN